jgi:hypothetical protein
MATVPRDADGNFLPPRYRFTSVRAEELRVGDRISWAIDGRGVVAEVLNLIRFPRRGQIAVVIRGDDGVPRYCLMPFNRTVNTVEVLRGRE